MDLVPIAIGFYGSLLLIMSVLGTVEKINTKEQQIEVNDECIITIKNQNLKCTT